MRFLVGPAHDRQIVPPAKTALAHRGNPVSVAGVMRPMSLVRLRALAALALASLAAACTTVPPKPPVDSQVPAFARVPFEAFSRENAIAIALREWRLFDRPISDAGTASLDQPTGPETKPERMPGLWERVGEYWWLGLNLDQREHLWTGKHGDNGQIFPPQDDGTYAWSAAFVSYVMRIAGAGTRFPYAASHSEYINRAVDRAAGRGNWVVTAERLERYAPIPGDLVCLSRGSQDVGFDDLPREHFASHCGMVVDREPGMLDVIGGNVDDAVALTHVPRTGRWAACGGTGTAGRHALSLVRGIARALRLLRTL